jgi:hypothetical protein
MSTKREDKKNAKYQQVQALRASGVSLTEACRKAHMGLSTYYKLNRPAKTGFSSLAEHVVPTVNIIDAGGTKRAPIKRTVTTSKVFIICTTTDNLASVLQGLQS